MIPVIAPVAPGRDGHTYNINADTFAGAIAGALNATRLLFLTDVPGVLDKNGELIKELSVTQARALIKDGTISGGMIPKVETCIDAIETGVQGVVILNGKTSPCRAAGDLHRRWRGHADRSLRSDHIPMLTKWPCRKPAGPFSLELVVNDGYRNGINWMFLFQQKNRDQNERIGGKIIDEPEGKAVDVGCVLGYSAAQRTFQMRKEDLADNGDAECRAHLLDCLKRSGS